MGCILAAPDIVDGYARVAVAVATIVIYTLLRTIVPVHPEPGVRRLIELTGEAGLMGLVVVGTGYYASPIAFSLLTAVSVAGFVAGFGTAFRLAGATSLAIGISHVTQGTDFTSDFRLSVQWAVELFLVSVVAAYARRITGQYDERQRATYDQLSRLADANSLLANLHQVAQDLPSSLDLAEVLDSTVDRLKGLVDFDTAAIIVHEPSDGTWSVARHYGARIDDRALAGGLPNPLRNASQGMMVRVPNLLRRDGPGLAPKAVSGLYCDLTARGDLIGLLAVERAEFEPFTDRDAELVGGFAEPAALAIDNARWFARLRTVGADEERTRIARDLHDRIGQSLAYLAFELDRIVRKDERGDAVGTDLHGVRDDVRSVVREVRDTLYDLRTDVSDDKTVPDVLEEFAGRVQDRSGIPVVLHIDETARVPRAQERELWRIAQEAIVNAERHSRASQIDVYWYADGTDAVAEVRDNGHGLPMGTAGRLDSYGMLGMRERASSIGASLQVDSSPQRGVTVRCSLRQG